jgi:magnesium-transporting ATPase (P-type)
VRNLGASEKLGGAKEILFSKTGILTESKNLKVEVYFLEGRLIVND